MLQAMRSVGAIVVLVLRVLCLVLAPAVVWGRNLLLDTDRYVQTLEPLIHRSSVERHGSAPPECGTAQFLIRLGW
jgi:hypothetical protein